MTLTPPRRRRILFILTPLIDVIFLLLIFFMLSSQIAPYSLMPIGRIAAAGTGGPASAAPTGTPPLTVRLSRGFVSAGGERIAIADLSSHAERFRSDGIAGFLLIPAATSTVQDVVSVLEALRNAGGEVTLLNARSAEP
jgi:biopolymer transport protein ExbD